MKASKIRKTNNQQGQVTLDFLFASVLILSVSALMMALTIALTLSEVIQYVTFSAARSYFAADENESLQAQAAANKANLLLSDSGIPFLRSAISNGWVTISGGRVDNGRAKSYRSYGDNLGVPDQDLRNQFTGYQIKFEVPILGLKLPFLGPAISPPEGQNGFQATVSSFLMREPTRLECESYTNKAYDALKQLNNNFSKSTSANTAKSFKQYKAINDNGC